MTPGRTDAARGVVGGDGVRDTSGRAHRGRPSRTAERGVGEGRGAPGPRSRPHAAAAARRTGGGGDRVSPEAAAKRRRGASARPRCPPPAEQWRLRPRHTPRAGAGAGHVGAVGGVTWVRWAGPAGRRSRGSLSQRAAGCVRRGAAELGKRERKA
ncbi:hypothetical protein ACRRTK_023257 [Alexandromys fortis]